MSDLPLRCSCGSLRGRLDDVSASRGNRIVCCCTDCQSFAHFLGRADEILDERGGTDLFQLSPSRIEITEGADQLVCLRLTPKGRLRWYAQCCSTPIANTLAWSRVPYAGLIHSCIDCNGDGRSRDEALGPVLARVHVAANEIPSLALMLRSVGKLLGAWLRGEHTPSPFFDARTGEARATPKVLNVDEFRELRSLVGVTETQCS